jgi:hypothetical protein
LRIRKPLAAAALTAAVAACSAAVPAAARAPVVTAKPPLVGVFEPGAPLSYAPVERFAAATGVQPRIAAWYSGWGDSFRTAFARQAAAHGALPLVQLNPGPKVSMASVADGSRDAWLRSYADAVRAYGKTVVIGFAPEMNGTWYQWGAGHTAPQTWIAAWRHVVTLFRSQGAGNVIWLWTVNDVNVASAPVSEWWPGSAYVSWSSIDGYYVQPSDTFMSVFGATITQIRRLTSDPVLISETANGPDSGPEREAQISGLFAGVQASGLAGLVWFDQAQHQGVYHQDWRLSDSPAALAAFRTAAEKYGR